MSAARYYKVTLTPKKTAKGQWTSHVRSVDIVLTASSDEDAERRVHESVVGMFVRTGVDFYVSLLSRM